MWITGLECQKSCHGYCQTSKKEIISVNNDSYSLILSEDQTHHNRSWKRHNSGKTHFSEMLGGHGNCKS